LGEEGSWPETLRASVLADLGAGLRRSHIPVTECSDPVEYVGVRVILASPSPPVVDIIVSARSAERDLRTERRLEFDDPEDPTRGLIVTTSAEELVRTVLGLLELERAATDATEDTAATAQVHEETSTVVSPLEPDPGRHRPSHGLGAGLAVVGFSGGARFLGAGIEYVRGPTPSGSWEGFASLSYMSMSSISAPLGTLRAEGVRLGLSADRHLGPYPAPARLMLGGRADVWVLGLRGEPSREAVEGSQIVAPAVTLTAGPRVAWEVRRDLEAVLRVDLGWTASTILLRAGGVVAARVGGACAQLSLSLSMPILVAQ